MSSLRFESSEEQRCWILKELVVYSCSRWLLSDSSSYGSSVRSVDCPFRSFRSIL